MQIVCFFKSDLHGTPRIATHRTTRHTRSDGPCIVLVSYPHTRYIDVRNATYSWYHRLRNIQTAYSNEQTCMADFSSAQYERVEPLLIFSAAEEEPAKP